MLLIQVLAQPEPKTIPIRALKMPEYRPIPSQSSTLPEPRPIPIPDLPNGKKILDIVVNKSMDSLSRYMFGDISCNFWENLTNKTVPGAQNFYLTSWTNGSRKMNYDFAKKIVFSQYQLSVKQEQVLAPYSRPGVVHAVDCVTQTIGHDYASCFHIKTHYKITADHGKCRLVVIAEVEFTQPSWFERQIKAEVWPGLENFCQALESQVLSEFEDLPANLDTPANSISSLNDFEDFPADPEMQDNLKRSCDGYERIENAELFDQAIQQQMVPLILSPSKNTEPSCWGVKTNNGCVFRTANA